MAEKIIINIGRQFGSGGKDVAIKLGEKLGIKVYDNELISRAAEESGFSKDLFIKSDEKRSILSVSNFFTYGRYGNMVDNYINDHELFKIQSEVIRNIAEKESAIFIGRCSDYILRDMKTLNVFISAPIENRISRICERLNIGIEQAKSLINKKDKTRESYYNHFSLKDWGVASNYDLCINSSILGIEGSADLIIDMAKRQGLL